MAERERLHEELAELLSLEPRAGDPGPAAPMEHSAKRTLIDGALQTWSPEAGAGLSTRAPAARRYGGWLLAGLVLCVGSAAAFYVAEQRAVQEESVPPVSAPAAVPTPSADAREIEDEDLQALEDVQEAVQEAAPAGEPVRVERSPEDLLARGNRLRGEGRYAEAERTYMRVVRSAPRSGSAHVARIAAADLRLERLDDAAGALKLYRRAGARPGPLSVEARAGTARALRTLGRFDEEQRALEKLLKHHDQGPAAARARKRLDELRTRGR